MGVLEEVWEPHLPYTNCDRSPDLSAPVGSEAPDSDLSACRLQMISNDSEMGEIGRENMCHICVTRKLISNSHFR